MRRDDLLACIRVAGYHGDQRAYMRLYTENRISHAAARDAYRDGERAKARGIACSCADCRKAKP